MPVSVPGEPVNLADACLYLSVNSQNSDLLGTVNNGSTKRAISLKVKRMNARLPATLGDVQRLFIHGQSDAVGELDGIGQQRELTTGTEAVHALK